MADEAGHIRSFIAIDFPPDTRRKIRGLIQQLKQIDRTYIRWVKPGNIHLTLKFLGDISPLQLAKVKEELPSCVTNIEPFSIGFEKLGLFPGSKCPQIIWLGIQAFSKQLLELYQSIETKMLRCGFPREDRKFTPHITLGRIKRLEQPQNFITQLNEVAIPAFQPLTITSINLMQSTLTQAGSNYNCLESFPFKG